MGEGFIRIVLLGVAVLCAAAPAFDGNKSAQAPDGAVLAEIDGHQVSRAEFERRSAARLLQARQSYYEAERKALDEFIGEYLLERQAQKENLTVPQLLERHVSEAIPKDPPDEVLRVYYEGVDTNEPYEAVKSKIIDHLRQRRTAKAKAAYLQSLREDSKIAILLTAPRVEAPLKDTPRRGPRDAPVLLVEYADYECPYCQQIQPALDKLAAEYRNKVAFAYKDVPLPNHLRAQKAAEAAHCAGLQGKYWEYHDVLLASKQLDVPDLQKHARGLKLDPAAFDKCLESGEQAEVVKAHLTEAQALGLQGTPSFLINGRLFSGALTYERLRELVEEELAAEAKGGKSQPGLASPSSPAPARGRP